MYKKHRLYILFFINETKYLCNEIYIPFSIWFICFCTAGAGDFVPSLVRSFFI